jgi:nucleosome binding factor SPN SPT16 subunit
LKNCIPQSFGYGIGLENPNSYLNITEDSNVLVQQGMVIFIHLSLENLDIKGKNFMMQIGDTVCIDEKGELINFTEKTPKNLNDIHYELKNNSEDNEEEESNRNNYAPDVRVTRHMGKKVDEKYVDREKRKEHQEQLLKEKNEDFKRRLEQGENFFKEEAAIKKKDYTNLKCYESPKQFPADLKNGKIYLDQRHFTVFLPIFKRMVPFHIGLIKNTSKSEDSNYTILRINFVVPITGNELESIKEPNPVFVREISYKFKDANYVMNMITKIKEMTKDYKAKEQEDKEKEDIVEQEKLIQRKEKRIALTELNIKPTILSKKSQGTLEAHANGFRFISNKNERVDIIYKNIKHAFLQTCENEMSAFVHFHLKNPILVGKKKVNDIQFYREIGSQADDINMKGRGHDYDEYEMELKEQKKIDNMNKEFLRFSKSVEDLGFIKFELPYRELEFSGVPFKANVVIYPTPSCIISLNELPFFVITVNEIEIVYFERVSQNLKNFDMAFIFKDYSRPIKKISAIPVENLDMLKSWADENDILFGEGQYNLVWSKIMAQIKDSPETFVEEGGWNFVAENVNEEEEEEELENDDPAYEEEEIESSEYDYQEEEEEESKGENEGDDALSEEGKDWDNLEEIAKKSDIEKAKRMKEKEKFKKNNKNRRKK